MATDFNSPVFERAWQLFEDAQPEAQNAVPAVIALFNENKVLNEDRTTFVAIYNRLRNVPRELVTLPRWLLYDANKVPLQASGARASSTAPDTWTTFQKAWNALNQRVGVGIGFVVNGDGLVGVDLDGCRNPETGEITEWAKRVVDFCTSYTEITPAWVSACGCAARCQAPTEFST
jgi:hypothetical protein